VCSELDSCAETLLGLANVVVTDLQIEPGELRVTIRSGTAEADCPACGASSARVHGRYSRSLTDLPSTGRRTVLVMRARRFVCANFECPKRTFAEQIPGVTRRHGRWSERLRSVLEKIGLALAGRAGARMCGVIGVRASRSTLLRLVCALPDPSPPAPVAVGIDDYALRKGHVYGTVVIDAETHRPLDLLPDREAKTVAAWLSRHPTIEVVCRDRGPSYIDGATTGAPQAIQVADRWHLWHNLIQTVERCVSGHTACIRTATADTPAGADTPATDIGDEQPDTPWPTGHRFADRVRATHAAVHELLATGHSQRAIARQLRMGGKTVARYARAATPEALFTGQWQNRRSKLDDYKPYLHQRWTSGFTNVWALWKEITTQGYTGGYGAVSAYIRPMRTTPQPVGTRPPSARAVAGWIATRPDNLAEEHRVLLTSVLAHCPELDALARHVRSFADMLVRLQGERLPQWITDIQADDLPRLHNFAAGLLRDLPAVTAGLTLPWNSGAVEGHVNRIKMLKRQMFGRAGFHLLRKRTLLA
jgi:transposase